MISTGFRTLLYKEVLRFWKVAAQTITAPVLTALLYLVVFGHALESHVQVFPGVSYKAFLIPGLVMMSVLQNSFANASSSLIQSKINGSMVFLLLSPVSHWETSGLTCWPLIVRGLTVGAGVFLATFWFQRRWRLLRRGGIIVFALFGSAILGTMGLIAGIWADKYDQLATFQNFLIMPATFSGVFYSIRSLPEIWLKVSHCNPFFYIIDGFRYGFGQSDTSPLVSLSVVAIFFLLLASLAVGMLKSGYKLRH